MSRSTALDSASVMFTVARQLESGWSAYEIAQTMKLSAQTINDIRGIYEDRAREYRSRSRNLPPLRPKR